MAIAKVGSDVTAAWSTGSTIPFTVSAPTNGNCLTICFGSVASTITISSISQTGAVWQKLKGSAVSRGAEIWYALNVSGAGTSVTVNLAGTAISGLTLDYSEWSGIAPSLAAGPTNGASGNSTTVNPGSVTPQTGHECVVLVASRAGGAVSAGPTNSFTGMTAPDTRTRCAYQIVASPSGTVLGPDYTVGSGTWDAVIGVLYAPPSGGAPTATITSQPGYSSYQHSSGRSITLTGTATDPEDGALTGASLVWTSNLDGTLGTGTSLTTSSLSVGSHTITLTATDSNGNTGADVKTVIVKNSASAHLIQRHFTATAIGNGSYTYSMQVRVPANYNPVTAYPFMVEVGGSGQRSTTLDSNQQMTDGYAATINANPSTALTSYGAIWCFPCFPGNGTYGGREWAYPMIAAALAQVQAEWNIDSTKLHFTGYSLGCQIGLESLYNPAPAWATFHGAEGCVTNREGLLSGNDPAGAWTNAQAAAEVAGRNTNTVKIRQYQEDSDVNNTPASAQVTRDAFFAVDPTHAYYNYIATSFGTGHVPAYLAMQADTTNLDWAFGITRAAGGGGGGSDPNPTPPSGSNRRRRTRRVAGVLL
jgi:hypothetical protein